MAADTQPATLNCVLELVCTQNLTSALLVPALSTTHPACRLGTAHMAARYDATRLVAALPSACWRHVLYSPRLSHS
jgi:hypothetical protein